MPQAVLPSVFVSHGAPTLALSKNATTDALARMGQNLPKPRAIVIMSAHWVSGSLSVSTAEHLKTWHDFRLPQALMRAQSLEPDALSSLKYPAKGDPALGQRLIDWLHKNDIDAFADSLRPLDHGVWVPLMHLYPEADVPVVQLSLPRHFDAHACYQLGAALSHFRAEQMLIVGSGSITHNLDELHGFGQRGRPSRYAYAALSAPQKRAFKHAHEFKHWLIDKLKHDKPAALKWQDAPHAKQNHPTPEHLLPLFFAAGAARHLSVVHSSVSMGTLGMDIYRFD